MEKQPMKMKYLSCSPAVLYYSWHVEVLLTNFLEVGIDLKDVHIVCGKQNGSIPPEWRKLQEHFKDANFFFYDDTRITKHYISSIRPNLLKQHFYKYPELNDCAIFYHDCDMIFTKPIEWDKFLHDTKWYGSDTRFYIAHSYIISKGQDIMDKMCEIVGISESVVKENEHNCIGAQYLLKGIDWQFWADVEFDSEKMYKEITEMNMRKKAENPNYHELQIFCSDMWNVLWHGWKRNKTTVCHPDFEFAWATSTEDDWNKLNIYHNAGCTTSEGGLFYKGEWMTRLPYNRDLQIREGTASKKYYELIQRVEKNSCLL